MIRKVTHPYPAPQGVNPQEIQSHALAEWFRELDDLSPTQARALSSQHGVSADSIVAAGHCKALLATKTAGEIAQAYALPDRIRRLPRGAIVVAVTGPDGAISGLQTSELAWLTSPSIHFANARRFRDGVYVCANTLLADECALKNNATALGVNGLPPAALPRALALFGSRAQLLSERVRRAA